MLANDPEKRLGSDLVARWYLGVLFAAGLIYAGLGWTPSSYGIVLAQLQAEGSGPVWGQARPIRSDEWAVLTPLIKAAVHNGFGEVNQTSFYGESLRSVFSLPLRNWSLVFRPQLWAFFLSEPATAFSLYFVILTWAFLAGYFLLFRELGTGSLVAALGAGVIFFSGFVQFWGQWSLAGVPWVLVVMLKRMPWWTKALILIWLLPATSFSQCYPPMFFDLAFVAVVLLLAVRPRWFKSPAEVGAMVIGMVVTGLVLYVYFAPLLLVMRNTVYPGHRTSPPGTVPFPVVLSQLWPFLAINLSGYEKLTGLNLVEIGTIGSYLPLLTLCVMRWRDFWANQRVRLSVLILLAGGVLMTLWQVAPISRWIGRVLLWDLADPERLFCGTGLLLTIACVLIWSNKLVTVKPWRIAAFLAVGPIASIALKLMLFPAVKKGYGHDIGILGFAMLACSGAAFLAERKRSWVLLGAVTAINFFEFGRFNPAQPAKPIFRVPETSIVAQLRKEAASNPDGRVTNRAFTGATLNGLGFRSVSHLLPAPELAFFRKYFPTMEPERFNQVFNRYAHITLSDDALPNVPNADVIRLPLEVFEPIRNVRLVRFEGAPMDDCVATVDLVMPGPGKVTVTGWAKWKGESAAQGIWVTSVQELRTEGLETVARPAIAENLHDYSYVKAGYRLQLASLDGQPVRTNALSLIAGGCQ